MIFVTVDSTALTGRGLVYAGIRKALHGVALFIGVPGDTVSKASDGYLVSEHGEAPRLLAVGGLVALSCSRWPWRHRPAAAS